MYLSNYRLLQYSTQHGDSSSKATLQKQIRFVSIPAIRVMIDVNVIVITLPSSNFPKGLNCRVLSGGIYDKRRKKEEDLIEWQENLQRF
jgi:hypothetical protein